MKNSYIYGVLSVGRELKKKAKEKNKINEKGLLKNPKHRKIRRKIKKDNIPYDENRR
jgi:hypothetical protein